MLHFYSLSGGRARRTSGAVLLVLLVSIAPLGAATPPWVVESPAAAGHGARFGLGLDYLFEHQESLRIGSQQSVTSLPTDDGGIRTMVVDGDPELLNRKFDLEWELKGPGVQVPLALSCFRLTDLIRVFPTLTLEAATVDVTLGSISKTELNPKVSLQGRGPMFGAKLGATASLCGSCPWFTGTSYHYRSLPAFEADRSPAFSEPGFEVLHDEVRLSQEVHEVSTKFGYIAPNKRVAYYTGVRARWTDVEIEDELRLANVDIRQEMGLSSRTKLKSEVIQAVAGVDAHLGGLFYARTEATYGDQDYGVLIKLMYVKPSKSIGPSPPDDERARQLREIAVEIIPRIAEALKEFGEDWRKLRIVQGPDGARTYRRGDVLDVLGRAEDRLLRVLQPQAELEPLYDWIKDHFERARIDLGKVDAKRVTCISPSEILLASLHDSFDLSMQEQRAYPSEKRSERIYTEVREPLDRMVEHGKFWTEFKFRTSPGDEVEIAIYPKYRPKTIKANLSHEEWVYLVYGDYSFMVYRLDAGTPTRLLFCNALSEDLENRSSPCPLGLMNIPRILLSCSKQDKSYKCESVRWKERR